MEDTRDKRNRKAGVLDFLVPVFFATLITLGIIWPVVLFTSTFMQAGLPPEAQRIIVIAMMVIFDIVALMKIFEGASSLDAKGKAKWTALVLLLPYIGAIACLLAKFEPKEA